VDRKIVTVFGSSAAEPVGALYQVAYELGRTVADLGLTLCNGGYGGTMEAAARGAVETGGHTIGVTCGLFGRGGPNRFIREEITASDLFERIRLLLELGRAYVVLSGGTGTLAELALAWELLNKRLLSGRRPLIVLGDAWRPLIDCVKHAQPDAPALHLVQTVAEVRAVLSQAFS
jgi:uncharacterized protein (TIGR00730 family)